MKVKKYKLVPPGNAYLQTWPILNEYLMAVKDIATCEALLEQELNGRSRRVFIRRIDARISRLKRLEAKTKIDEVINAKNKTSSD